MPDSIPAPDANFWKRKLAAFLHDSPDKVLDILDHENRARRIAGVVPIEELARKESDWTASAADRLPFPPSSTTKSDLSCFKHPLGQSSIPLNKENLPVGVAEETSQRTRPSINEDDPRAAFFATWRFWRNWASSRHADFALYPAETRLPDHTIWNHLAVTSAMQGCLGGSAKDYWEARSRGLVPPPTPDHPAFLLFTLGPVQDFISAARSTRDLWSGSYLLSYLIGHVLRRIALDFGPDHVLFPNLCDQPIIDLLLRDDLWNKVSTSQGQDLYSAFGYYDDDGRERLLTPSLPNRFLAVLPANMSEHHHRGPAFQSAESYARYLAEDLRGFLMEDIAADVADAASDALRERFDRPRFNRQIHRLLEIHWQVLPWPDDFAAAERIAQQLPRDNKDYAPRAGLEALRDLASHGADPRYLAKGLPKNVASAWSALYSGTEWLLDGTKANRAFTAPTGLNLEPDKSNSKDSLNGRDEAVLIVEDQDDAKALSARLEQTLDKGHLLKAGEVLGAATLLKRLWPFAHLCKRYTFQPKNLNMPNTRSIAAHLPWEDDEGDGEQGDGESYFAILALDGDSMGKWISGAKTPRLEDVLSRECAAVFRAAGANLENHRPLSPSWHLQFSEALSNFSQHAVRRIVEAYDGRLLFAGGDDVLAMVPADTALACAEALRLAFRGDPALNEFALGALTQRRDPRRTKKVLRSDRATRLFNIAHPGFLQLDAGASSRHGADAPLLDDPINFPVIVPGPAADVSVGIAVAHYKSPLQDVVQAARLAEKRAKTTLGRSAVAVSLFKRSGEITEWGCKWDDGGLPLYHATARALLTDQLSAKFPHRLCEILTPFVSEGRTLNDLPNFPFAEVIRSEFARLLSQHEGKALDRARLTTALDSYLIALTAHNPSHAVHHLIGLATVVAFNARNLPKGQ